MFIDFSYETDVNSPVYLDNNGNKTIINIVNICQVLYLLDKTHIGDISNTIDPLLEKESEKLFSTIFDSFVFVFQLNLFINDNNTPINNIKSTIISVFNKYIKKLIPLDIDAYGNEYIKYLPFKNTDNVYNLKEKSTIEISTSKDGLHFYELKDISNYYNYYIYGDDSYEAEYIYWTLKDDYKIENVIDTTNKEKILEDYEKFNKVDKYPNFKHISINKLKTFLNSLKYYKIQNIPLEYYQKLVNTCDKQMFGFDILRELTGEKYLKILFLIISNINKHCDDGNIDFCKKYILMFLTQFHIVDKNNSQMFNVYMDFLDSIINVTNKLGFKYEKIINTYRQNFCIKYNMFSNALDLSKKQRIQLSKEITQSLVEDEIEDEIDIFNGIKNLCNDLSIPFDMWSSIVRHKSSLKSDYSHQTIQEWKDYLLKNGILPKNDNNNISNTILILSSIAFKLFRIFVKNNKWKRNNPFMELILGKLKEFNDYYIANLDYFHGSTLPRITTIVSTYYSLILRYNFDNNKVDPKLLMDLFYKDLKLMYDKNVTIQYEGATIKILEDLGKLQLIMNYYDYKHDILKLFMDLYFKLNNIIFFFYDYNITLFNIYNKPKSGRFVMACEHAEALLGSIGIVDKNIISMCNKNTEALNRNYLFLNSFSSYLGQFNHMDNIKFKHNKENYYFEVTPMIIDWELIY